MSTREYDFLIFQVLVRETSSRQHLKIVLAKPMLYLFLLTAAWISAVYVYAGPQFTPDRRGTYPPLESAYVDFEVRNGCDFAGQPRECSGHVHFQFDPYHDYGFGGDPEFVGKGTILMYAPACSRTVYSTSRHPEGQLFQDYVNYPNGFQDYGEGSAIAPGSPDMAFHVYKCKQYPVRPGTTWQLRPNWAALGTSEFHK